MGKTTGGIVVVKFLEGEGKFIVITKGEGTTISHDGIVLPFPRILSIGIAIKGMHPIPKEAKSLALRETTGFIAGAYRSVREKQTMVRGLTQDFMSKQITRLAIATRAEAIV